ncbi:hypothetical protein IWX90DRAFT_192809 [Phyllosticta citrichinensis]|uniref:C2H2-type domain-containing protein n=1 Tax=Phyllosticta citrichinensis TaxID=1130410 RepID=A0ABR1XWX3_9PEZI
MALSDQRATYLLFPIAEQVRKCLDSFHELGRIVLSPSRNEAKNLSAFEVSDAADRFRIWAGNIGAHRKDRGSLDYRLRDASHIKDSVLDLLDALLNKMEKASAILRGERLPMEELEFESDSDSEFEEATHEGPVEPFHEATELGQLMESIKEVISMLLRTSMVIRKPAPHDHFANFNQVSTTHFEEFDLRHIQDKFPKASRTLVERLARATASRRSYLKYREDRQINLAAGLDSFDDGGLENKSQPAPSIIATSLNTIIKTAAHLDLDAFSEAGKTETSFASSFHGQNDNILKLPRIPKDGLDGGPFQCPLCFGIISAKTENSWKKHVSKDLAPYVCTFDSCSVPFRRFEKRREWFEHELSHRSKWKCPQNCEKIFDTQQELSEHLKQHSGTFTDPSGECQMRPNATFCVDCALCGKSLPLAQLQSHLGEHQQQLALFALPLQIRNSENDDDFDDDSEAPEEASVDEGGSDTEGSADEDVDANAEEDILDQVEDSEPVGEATQAEESPMREEFDFGTPAFVPINPVFYDCAFSFLGCQYVAGPSDEKEWKEHVLSHFHSHGPPWAVKCPLCDWDFEDSDGRRAWDIRMNHVAAHHRAGQRLRLNDPFWIDPNLLRYLWQKRIIDDEEYEALSASKQLGNDRRVAEHGNRSQRQHRPRRRLDSNGEDVSEADEISVDREALEEDREENEEAETAKSKESGWETLVQTPSEERSDMVRTWLRKGPQDHPAPSPQEGQIELPVNHDQPNAPVSPLDENPQAKVPTYIKIRKEHIEQETLAFFGLLWDWDQSHSDYVVIFRELDNRETDMLFEHTKALRKHRMDSPESDFIWKPESIDHPHEPPQATIPTYPKIHKDHVEQESLAYFGLPWEWDRVGSHLKTLGRLLICL